MARAPVRSRQRCPMKIGWSWVRVPPGPPLNSSGNVRPGGMRSPPSHKRQRRSFTHGPVAQWQSGRLFISAGSAEAFGTGSIPGEMPNQKRLVERSSRSGLSNHDFPRRSRACSSAARAAGSYPARSGVRLPPGSPFLRPQGHSPLPCSSMVERRAVTADVPGSSPGGAANLRADEELSSAKDRGPGVARY